MYHNNLQIISKYNKKPKSKQLQLKKQQKKQLNKQLLINKKQKQYSKRLNSKLKKSQNKK